MTGRSASKGEIDKKAKLVERQLCEHVADRGKLGVVQAPPGSGKTWLLLKTVSEAYRLKRRVAIAAQTNSQVDDICRRFAASHPTVPVIRFAAAGAAERPLGASVSWKTKYDHLPHGACVVVATAAKWGLVTVTDPFDILFIEEAWQLAWADFMLLGQVAERFVLIGDPGQIAPVVSVDVARWETSPRPPHLAAPRVILGDAKLHPDKWQLPASRRLPDDTVDLIRPFYDFGFDAYAGPGERTIAAGGGGKSPVDQVIDLLQDGSTAGLTIPTPDEGPPLDQDDELAKEASKIVKRLLARGAKFTMEGKNRPLQAEDIGLCSTHRIMNTALDLALPKELRGTVVVDTPERWQGLERPLMIVIHPLSGVLRPSAFDLETGRLCVMASRHLAGMVVLSRDHVTDTLGSAIPSAEQAVGRPDVAGRGLYDNLQFWTQLAERGRLRTG